MPLPRFFCWTRFGTEAGERIDHILARKEKERQLNGGVFLWGVGNAVGPSIRQLIQLQANPEVIFSPIRSAPRKVDVAPDNVVMWTMGETLEGTRYELPAGSLVTSSYRRRKNHYALVCASSKTLRIRPEGEIISFSRLRNLLTNKPIGASQVTAIVQQATHSSECIGLDYLAAIRAHLVDPYFIKLFEPVPILSTF